MIVEKTVATPADVGYNASRLDVLHNFIQGQIDKKVLIGGSYALARDGKLFASAALGKQSYREDDGRPLKPDTIWRVYSITKLFTSVAVFQLVENGLCRPDEPMKNFISEMDTEDFASVTVMQALSHTGGFLPDEGFYPPEESKGNVWQLIRDEFEAGGTDWVSAVLRVGGSGHAGKRWEYATSGFMMLGEMIRRITGKHAHTYIEEEICKPCGMSDSGFWRTMKKRPDIRERLLIQSPKTEEALNAPDEDSPWDAVPETGNGLHSTVADLVKFGNMLLNGGQVDGRHVLSRKAIEMMTTEKYALPNYGWGNGGGVSRAGYGPNLNIDTFPLVSPGTFTHEGWGRSNLLMDPKERLVTAYFVPIIRPDVFDPVTIYNAVPIIWSGLK